MGGTTVCMSKIKSITAGSSTVSEFITAHTAAKALRYLCMLLKQLGYEQKESTHIYNDNIPALKMINDNTSPTE